MTALALPRWESAVGDPRPAEMGASWHGRILLRLALRMLHADELRALTRAEAVATDHLVGARNGEDLDVLVDELATRPEIDAATRALVSLASSPLMRLTRRRRPRDSAWAPLGPVASKLISLGFTYAFNAEKGLARLPASVRRELDTAPTDPLALIYDVTTPVEVSRALLAMRRVPVCLFALGRCLESPKALPRWMVIDLAERFMLGQRGALCLVATCPGIEIPDDVLPPEHRLDVSGITARTEAQVASWDELPVVDSLPADESDKPT